MNCFKIGDKVKRVESFDELHKPMGKSDWEEATANIENKIFEIEEIIGNYFLVFKGLRGTWYRYYFELAESEGK